MTSTKQISANRHNSRKSTGPKSVGGKAVASRNATRHGILSSSLFLPDEDPATFQQLFEELAKTFNPVDTLEMVLVEKIAVAIWKQRRIVAAETAAITLNRQDPKLFKSVNNSLDKYMPYDKVTTDDLTPLEPVYVTWSETIIKEWNKLVQEDGQEITVKEMKKKAPQSWQNLQVEAAQVGMPVNEFLNSQGIKLYDWFLQTKQLAETVLVKAHLRAKVSELYNAANAEMSILPDKPRASFERYQTTLDNQLYRAIKELRLLQDRRLRMIEMVVPANVGETSS